MGKKSFQTKLWAVIAVCAMLSVIAAAQEKQKPSPVDLFPGEDTLPILAWIGIPTNGWITVERFQEMKDAGFNLNLSWIRSQYDASIRVLDVAHQAGMRCIYMSDRLSQAPEETVKAIKNHPGLAGYFLRDEPFEANFKELGQLAKRIMDMDPDHFCYINLLPTYGKFESLEAYRGYVRHFIEEVPIPLVSFDHYPILKDSVEDWTPEQQKELLLNLQNKPEYSGADIMKMKMPRLRPDWYSNLEIIAEESRRAGRPFWAFALSITHGNYPIPTMEGLRLQMYSNLAYGAQGLQYFTYWHTGNGKPYYDDAPITRSAKRSTTYDRIREINHELQARAFVFVRSRVVAVNHLGETIPDGTKRLENLPPKVKKLDTYGKGAIVSQLEKQGRRYLAIVNRSLSEEMNLTITFEPGVKRILKDGSIVDASKYMDTLWLTPGECEIFEL